MFVSSQTPNLLKTVCLELKPAPDVTLCLKRTAAPLSQTQMHDSKRRVQSHFFKKPKYKENDLFRGHLHICKGGVGGGVDKFNFY